MSIPTGDHGGDARRVAAALGVDRASLLDLSQSLNPCAPDVSAIVAGRLDATREYPDDRAASDRLAAAIGVEPGRLVLTNGGAEAIALVADDLGAGALVEPEFSLYRRHLPVVDETAGRWRSNPSSPLGRFAATDDRAAVWDEAFWPLAAGTWTRGDDAAWRLGSLTKLWACPGLRIGYAIAPDDASAARLRGRQTRWSVGSLALAVVEPLLDVTDLPAWAAEVDRLRCGLAEAIAAAGFDVTPTDANWVIVRSPAPLRDLLAHRGVVVRECASFGLAGTFRVAVPPAHELARVVDAFEHVAATSA